MAEVNLHVWPRGDIVRHLAAPDCICVPEGIHVGGGYGRVYLHGGVDGRDRTERDYHTVPETQSKEFGVR